MEEVESKLKAMPALWGSKETWTVCLKATFLFILSHAECWQLNSNNNAAQALLASYIYNHIKTDII